MPKVDHCPLQNCLLAALPKQEFERLAPHLDLVHLPLGHEMYKSGVKLDHVYFPTTSIVSLLHVLENGSCAEIAIIGSEGVLGVSLFLDGDTMPGIAVVQSAGWGYRLNSRLLMQEFSRGGPLMSLLLRYTQALIAQMTQTAVCNRHHSIDQQLCRWLLISLDCLKSNSLTMTQELIANMLGVKREGVSRAAGALQDAGYIRYSRGKITVLDRSRLELRVCECYKVVRNEFARLLNDISPHDSIPWLGESMPNPECQATCQFLTKRPPGIAQMRTHQCQTICRLTEMSSKPSDVPV
jgi:CRP-like cAMP-binding protein